MIKKKIKKKDNVINFPSKLSSVEKEIEAIVFAAAEPLDINTIENKISKKTDVEKILLKLQLEYSDRGINLVCISTSVFFEILFSIVTISNGSAAAKTIASISFSIEESLDGKLIMLSFFLIFFFIICFL